jgi:class 3 adenylate cyclase/tetratricopeptide (TPR) repeat protein
MKCPKCQIENTSESRFCGECGQSLHSDIICKSCGALLPEGSRFCNMCGYDLGSAAAACSKEHLFDEKLKRIRKYLPEGLADRILAQREKIEGERKQVTVMFCDMQGFTPFVEKLGPDKAYAVMDQVYEILIRNVHDYEGTVNEMTGDGIMALFGVPIALEDAPQRALRSALSIHNEIKTFHFQEEAIAPIRMRVGVHTGPVVVGTLGNDLRLEFKAVGDTVNLASRMESLAKPGTTYVTKDTYQLTQGLFGFNSLGPKPVKGKTQPIPVYQLLSEKKGVYRPRLGSERMIYSEMVGRENELDTLEQQLLKAVNKQGSIINIIGEAGIGKSRLIAEFKKREIVKGLTVLEGRSISIGRNLSFHPIIDLIKHWAKIRTDDSPVVAYEKLETAINRICHERIAEIFPFLAVMMGMSLRDEHAGALRDMEGEGLQKLIVRSIGQLLKESTSTPPLVIIMEDLHWADTSSIEILEYLFRLAQTERIVFVNVFRPGHEGTGERIIQKIREQFIECNIEITLLPLNEQVSSTLISNILNITGVHFAAIKRIISRAGGNPLFVEEIVRSLIDEGVVAVKNGSFEITDKIETAVIPQNITDLLMARIDRLEEKTRELVKVASVIGRSFFYRVLSDVGKRIEELDDRLSYLKGVQLIREHTRMEEIEFIFKHALVQEAAYESILQKRKKELHLEVGNSIESIFDNNLHEFYGMLAFHYLKAENYEKAEKYMLKAGEQALNMSASSEALMYFQQGLRLYVSKYNDNSDPEKMALFERSIAIAFYNKGQFEDAMVYFDRALERRGMTSPKNNFAMVFRWFRDFTNLILRLYFPIKRQGISPTEEDNETFSTIEKWLCSIGFINPKRCFFESFNALKRLNKFNIEEVRNAVSLYGFVSNILTISSFSLNLPQKLVEHIAGLIDVNSTRDVILFKLQQTAFLYFSGNWDQIEAYDEALVNRSFQIVEPLAASFYTYWYGLIKLEQGDFKSVEQLINKLSEIHDTLSFEKANMFKYILMSKFHMKSCDFESAGKVLDRAINLQNRMGLEPRILFLFGLKCISLVLEKNSEGAKETLKEGERVLSQFQRVIPYYRNSYLLGQAHFFIAELEKAFRLKDQSKIAKYGDKAKKGIKKLLKNSRKFRGDKTESLRLTGTYYWQKGQKGKAAKWFGKSFREATKADANVELARTYMEVGKRFCEDGKGSYKLNGMDGVACLEEAAALFKQMNLSVCSEELEKIKRKAELSTSGHVHAGKIGVHA